MKIKSKILIILFLSLLTISTAISAYNEEENKYIYFPKAFNTFELKFAMGLSLTKLPTQIVEEEINSSPSLFFNSRLGLPLNLSLGMDLATNYISNIGTISLDYRLDLDYIYLSAGVNGSMWFGHVEFESIKLKSYGLLYNPIISVGINLDNEILLTTSIETQSGIMSTFSDDSLLATFKQPNSNFIFRISLEQPLWNDNWVCIGVKFNFASFYYQSWLSYSAIKDYLLYPEFYFGFIL